MSQPDLASPQDGGTAESGRRGRRKNPAGQPGNAGAGADPGPHAERLAEIARAHLHLEGPLLPILHAVQAEFGHVPQGTAAVLARELNLGRAEVHGVISFYHDLRSRPAGRQVLRLCRAEACQSVGGRALADQVMAALGLDWGQTSADGAVTLEPVYCLGLCACGPAAELDGRMIGRAEATALLAGVGK